MDWMRRFLVLALGALWPFAVASAGTIGASITPLGTDASGRGVFEYSFELTGFTFALNQELDIRFDPSRTFSLANGVAPPEYDVLLLQPGVPPGAFGDYTALALVANPATSGQFAVQVTALLGVTPPVTLPYAINQYELVNGILQFTGVVETGTVAADVIIPEPGSLALVSSGIAALAAVFRKRRQNNPAR